MSDPEKKDDPMPQAEQKPRSAAVVFSDRLVGERESIAKQLPKGVDADRFIRTAITTVNLNPELLTCTLSSLYASLMQAAKDGLLPDGKEAVIQPYNCKISVYGQPDRWEKQAQYMPMVRGLIQVMFRTGDVAMVDGVAVREKDFFEYERGDEPRIVHRPYWGSENPGQVVAAYVIIKLHNGEVKREVMSRYDIERVRDASKAKNGPGWTNWYDQFAIKAVIKRAQKQLPTDSEELRRVIEHDNKVMEFEFGDQPRAVGKQSVPRIAATPSQPSRLASIMAGGIGRQPEDIPVEFDEFNTKTEAHAHE